MTGTIGEGGDEDWIIIELSEGTEYTITVSTRHTVDDTPADTSDDETRAKISGGLEDSVLKLLDSKGGQIDMNDDVDPRNVDQRIDNGLSSKIVFTPEAGSGTQKYYLSVSGYAGNPGAMNNTGGYTVTVTEKAVLAAGAGADIEGTPAGDKLTGTDASESIAGRAGDDVLDGRSGDDTLDGGPGDDWYHLVAGEDNMTSDDVMEMMDTDTMKYGTDTITFAKSEHAIGASGADNDYDIPDNVENVIGTSEDDFITGNGSMNTIEGGDGADTLSGGATTVDPGDTLSYAGSDRRVRVDLGDDTASGGHASGDTITADTFENVTGSAHGDVLTGDDNDNVLKGLDGDDTLEGGLGDDTLEGGAGADELNGGKSGAADIENTEHNTLSYAGSDAGVTVNLATASASGGHADGDDIETYEFQDADGDDTPGGDDDGDKIDVATFVHVTGSMHGDTLTGDMFDNELSGGKGDDTLRGGKGSDRLTGGEGMDDMDGGKSPGEPRTETGWDPDNTDWAVYRSAKSGVTVNMATGKGEGGEAAGDSLKNIEVVWGSRDHDDMFIAGPGPDIFHGDGHNTKPGGKGDTVSFQASKHAVNVDLATHNSNGGYDDGRNVDGDLDPAAEVVTGWTIPTVTYDHDGDAGAATPTANVPGIPAAAGFSSKGYQVGDLYGGIENLTGSSLDDTLAGNANSNILKGGDGKDTLTGVAGDDTLEGEGGDDMLDGGAGEDTLKGGAGRDTIVGGAGDDTINGGAGDDDLTGDASGDDGSAAQDIFVFEPGHGSDVIVDFNPGTTGAGGDKIDLKAFGLDSDDLKAPGVITVRAGNIVINLEGHGGGRITLQGDSDLDVLDTETDDGGNAIGTLSVYGDTNGNGTIETGEDGIFIL